VAQSSSQGAAQAWAICRIWFKRPGPTGIPSRRRLAALFHWRLLLRLARSLAQYAHSGKLPVHVKATPWTRHILEQNR
jgi:hypothetical protein